MSLPNATASAQYKKQDGTISLSNDRKTVQWTPASPPGASPSVNIATAHLTNLQQTPISNPKAALKLFLHRGGSSAPENFSFTFSSLTTARDELNRFVELLKAVMEANKAGTASASLPTAASPASGGTASVQSAAMAIAQAVSSAGREAEDDKYADTQLLANIRLQQALLDRNAVLKQRFSQASLNKPASLSQLQVSHQFWSTRIHMLRSFAAESQQHKGEYNVISDIQVKNEGGANSANLTRDKINMIWKQYPFMLQVFNELVPKALRDENAFWGEFLASRLFMKLKGEKITESHPENPRFDRYLDLADNSAPPEQFKFDQVPRFIDLEGNEQNHSQRKGNAPDWTMKPSFGGRVPILNALNNMSERLMVNVAPSDEEAHAPVGVNEEKFDELRLQDLQRNDKDNRMLLSISDQRRSSPTEYAHGDASACKPDLTKVLKHVRSDIRGELHLPTDFGEEDVSQASTATSNMMKSINLRASHTEPGSSRKTNVSTKTMDSAVMAQDTTIEFLHYFWSAYLSGDAARADEVRYLFETMQNSNERFKIVAEDAEKERNQRLETMENAQRDLAQNKRRRIDKSKLRGGKQAVEDMFAATKKAVNFAESEYRRTFIKQNKRQGLGVS